MQTKPAIKTAFQEATEEVQGFLPDPNTISETEAREIIQRYLAAIEGNFVNWMAAAMVASRSPQA